MVAFLRPFNAERSMAEDPVDQFDGLLYSGREQGSQCFREGISPQTDWDG